MPESLFHICELLGSLGFRVRQVRKIGYMIDSAAALPDRSSDILP